MKTDGLKARPVGRAIRLLLGVLLVAEGGRYAALYALQSLGGEETEPAKGAP